MALTDNNKTTLNQNQRAPQAGIVDPGIPGYGQPVDQNTNAARSIQAVFSGGINREPNSGLVSTITERAKELLKAADHQLAAKLDVFPAISSSLGSVGIDAIIISTLTAKGVVVYYVLVTEDSAAPLKALEINRGGSLPTLRVDRPVTSHINARSKAVWESLVLRQYTQFGASIAHSAGYEMLYKEITPKITGTDTNLRDLTINEILRVALNAVGFHAEEITGGTNRIISANLLRSFDRPLSPELELTYTNRPQTIQTNSGLFRRSTAQLNVGLRPKNPVDNNDGVILENIDIAVADCYIDLHYDESLELRNPPVTQRYAPEVVLTGIDSPQNFLTPQIQLFGILAAAAWGNGNNWVQYFLDQQQRHDYGSSKKAGNKITRPIGAVGYECTHLQNVAPEARKPEYLAVNATTNPDQVADLILAAIDGSQLKVSIDVSLAEDGQSWLNSLILGAASNLFQQNQPNDQAAYNAFYDWCDRSTEGQFSKLFQRGAPIAYDKNVLVPNGYFEAEGEQQDVREIDYLALLYAHGKTGDAPRVLTEYSRIYDQHTSNEVERADAFAKGILDNYKGVVIKGHFRRVQIDSDFIRILIEAFKLAGITFSMSQSGHSGTGGVRRHHHAIGAGLQANGLFSTNNNFVGASASGNLIGTSWSNLG